MSTPDLHLNTCLVFNDEGRIVATREPEATHGPLFTLVRGPTSCAWAVRADVPAEGARELDRLAREEPPTSDLREGPVHADRYVSLLRAQLGVSHLPETKPRQSDGPAFEFPDSLLEPADIVAVEDERLLERH